MNGLQSHRWKSMWMNSIHHVTSSKLAFLVLWQRKINFLIEFELETWCELTRVKHLPTQNATCVEVKKNLSRFQVEVFFWGEESHIFKIRFQISNLVKINDLESFKGSWKSFACWKQSCLQLVGRIEELWQKCHEWFLKCS